MPNDEATGDVIARDGSTVRLRRAAESDVPSSLRQALRAAPYVLPGPWRSSTVWAPLIVAAAATLSLLWWHAAADPALRPPFTAARLAALAIPWVVAVSLIVWTSSTRRSAGDAAREDQARADSLKTLDEIRYALDQAAIVATTDQRGIITSVNEKFCQISKYSREELLGQDHRIINSGYHPKPFMRDLWRTIAQGQVWRGELRNRAKDGSFYWVDTTIVPLVDNRGKPRQYLSIRSDITQRKIAEGQLREQAALTRLGQLAAVVAHEVRNPLAGLRAPLQVLERRTPDARDREVIAAMIQRIDGLNEKVEDLLLYARPKPPRLQAVDVRAVVHDAVVSARAATASAVRPPDVVAPPGVRVFADPDMLRAAVLNLMMNAYQAAGSAPVEIDIVADTRVCRIAVSDRGPGIPPEIRDRVFEPFFTTRAGGTGLGLAIVKRLLELQDGGVELTSRAEGGTVAEVTMPLAPVQ